MIRRVRARWTGTVLVCAKCEKKLGGGFGEGGREPLSKLLKRLAGGKGPKARFGVVSSKCLKLCPKRAVAVVDAARPRDWLVVAPGTSVAEVAAELGMVEPTGGAPVGAELADRSAELP